MKRSLFDANVPRECRFCEKGRASANENEILCTKKGIMRPDSCCRKYRYDPLKRKPERPEINNDFSPDDFKL